MPCRDDGPDPRYLALQERVELLIKLAHYLDEKLGQPSFVAQADLPLHRKRDALAAHLCATIKTLDEDVLNTVMYDGRSSMARKLAEFWEEHQLADRKREEAELAKKQAELERLQREQAADEAEFERLKKKLGK